MLPEDTSEKELLKLISELNANPTVHGILVQAPLPATINEATIFAAVSPNKDVDGFHPVNVGKLLLGDSGGFVPCTPAGVHELLIRSSVPIQSAEVVILGRGNIVGKPMAAILCQKAKHANATITLCHSRTANLADHCRRADILIAAIGVAEFVTAGYGEAWCHSHRRGREPHCRSQSQERHAAGGRCGLHCRPARGRSHHAQPRRRRADDHRAAHAQHRPGRRARDRR